MPFLEMVYTGKVDGHLLRGCCIEADRADIVSLYLEGLRNALPDHFHAHMTALIEEIHSSSRALRDLADQSQAHLSRVPMMLNYLNIVLPCLSRTLHDITAYYEDKTVSKEIRWRRMYNKMKDEVGGLPLPQRFLIYNHFLGMLKLLLTRSPNFDLNALDSLRSRIMQLREARGICPPSAQVGPVIPPEMMAVIGPVDTDPNAHWAEQIFSLPLPSRTALKHIKPSTSWGPHQPLGTPLNTPKESQILFRRPFDDDRLSLVVYLNLANQCAFLLIRTFHMNTPWFSLRGAHELCIHREGSALQLRRWSQTAQCSKPWASLYFQTWEEMVLFHSTFVSLKARNALTVDVRADEYKLAGERRLFQAQIIDDGYRHSLIVFQDMQTKGIRLHAAVWDGELRRCPVWTAFVTHQSASPTWLQRKSRHRVWLKDIQLYVFCQRYRQQNQRRGRAGAFEIFFSSPEAAARFCEVFYGSSAGATTDDDAASVPQVEDRAVPAVMSASVEEADAE
ncbi:hypothetical protein SODALDRAFT_85006 [Sodiomyces alkalinus F11]|uniref:Uncharacterized protein n=1 Tax=Sodiomyces alkalinus (strain CBS 110278 / VKM F-3762 / F11) TaxID=1314773 RepID=A0A3N2PJU4_SODAK|nr:hypothetical protein SODALDRAFT_85006 [Sodiomyces alkalinus F11]ROT34779.1 hypothetical protein SODALDRAFT_85006 [Sodiomyces alkalinus F11]